MQRRHVFPLLASAALAGATVLRASPTGDPSQCSQFHVDWVTKVLERMQTIKPGSTRKAAHCIHDRGWSIDRTTPHVRQSRLPVFQG